jgi:hypothetical protein
MADMRSPLAKARDDWKQSEDFKCLTHNPGSLGEPYLGNRLEAAFISGWTACQRHTTDRVMKVMAKTMKSMEGQ